MNIRKIVGMEGGVSDFQLEIAPKTLLLPKGARSFALYLEKGMQVLGRFQSQESSPLKQQFYRFRRVAPAAFYLNNLAHSHYTWSLYSVNLETGDENLESSATFDLERTVRLYQMELLEKQRQIQTSIKEKSISMKIVLELWGRIKREMKTYRSNQKCVFANQNFEIEFQVEIKNALDFEAELWEEEQQRNQSQRGRTDQPVVYFNSSENKAKKARQHMDKVIELQSQPYRANTYDKQDKEVINTKETISYEQESPNEGFNATVKIMNPKGEEIDADKAIQLADSGGFARNNRAIKKFSLLSDIIEMSCEGSSSYGQPDRSSSNGAKTNVVQKEGTMDMVIQQQEPIHEPFVLNKVKTLPYETHHKLQVRDEFRRAQTAEKNQSESSQMQDQQVISINELPTTTTNFIQSKPSTIMPKWVLLAGIILLLGLIFGGSWSGGSKRKRRNKH